MTQRKMPFVLPEAPVDKHTVRWWAVQIDEVGEVYIREMVASYSLPSEIGKPPESGRWTVGERSSKHRNIVGGWTAIATANLWGHCTDNEVEARLVATSLLGEHLKGMSAQVWKAAERLHELDPLKFPGVPSAAQPIGSPVQLQHTLSFLAAYGFLPGVLGATYSTAEPTVFLALEHDVALQVEVSILPDVDAPGTDSPTPGAT